MLFPVRLLPGNTFQFLLYTGWLDLSVAFLSFSYPCDCFVLRGCSLFHARSWSPAQFPRTIFCLDMFSYTRHVCFLLHVNSMSVTGWVNVCARTCLSVSTAVERKKDCVDRQRVIPIDHMDIRYPVLPASFIWSQTSCKLDLLLRSNYIRYLGILVISLRLFVQKHTFMNATRQI